MSLHASQTIHGPERASGDRRADPTLARVVAVERRVISAQCGRVQNRARRDWTALRARGVESAAHDAQSVPRRVHHCGEG